MSEPIWRLVWARSKAGIRVSCNITRGLPRAAPYVRPVHGDGCYLRGSSGMQVTSTGKVAVNCPNCGTVLSLPPDLEQGFRCTGCLLWWKATADAGSGGVPYSLEPAPAPRARQR